MDLPPWVGTSGSGFSGQKHNGASLGRCRREVRSPGQRGTSTVPVVGRWRWALLSSSPTLHGWGRERLGVGTRLCCPACPLDASQSRRTLRLTGQGQKRPSATCGDASPPSPVCRAHAFCAGGAKFGLNLPPFLRYLPRPPSELASYAPAAARLAMGARSTRPH